MWWKALLSAWLVTVALSGAKAQGLSSYEMMYADPQPDPNCDCDIDLIFLVDGSSSVGEAALQLAKDYINHVIECFNCTNVGLIYCKCESKRCIPLCVYDNIADLTTAVQEVPFFPSKTRVGYCIYYSQCTTNWRDGVPSVMVVLSDGQIYGTYEWGYFDDVAYYSQNARDAGISTYAVAVGRDGFINDNGLVTIAGDDSRVFDTADEDPSWLITIITIEHCGTCIQLIKAIELKRPYPWEEDTGSNEGSCSFEERSLEQACKTFTTSACLDDLMMYFRGFWDSIMDIWARIKQEVLDFINGIKSTVEALIATVQEAIDTAEQAVQDAIQGIIDETRGTIGSILGATQDIIRDLTPSVTGIIDGIQDVICNVINEVSRLIDAIRDIFERLVKELFDAYCDYLEGVIAGLTALIDLPIPAVLVPDFVTNFLVDLRAEAQLLLFLKKIARLFGDALGRRICRFLWWLIRPSPLLYPEPFNTPFLLGN